MGSGDWARLFGGDSLPEALHSMVLRAQPPALLDSVWGLVEVFTLHHARGESLLLSMEAHPLNQSVKRLSPMQQLVASHAINGATVLEIALELKKKPETIRTHLRIIYRKLAVSNRVELSKLLR